MTVWAPEPEAADVGPRSTIQADASRAAGSRRWLLAKGAALAAGAAGAAVVSSAPRTAHAADNDPVLLGVTNESTSTTTLTVGGARGSAAPSLSLRNADGPSLHLQPLRYEFAPPLQLGEILNTDLGPIIGVDTVHGLTTTYLVTGVDLVDVPTPVALPKPSRLLDTRTAAGRASVLRTSSNAYDTDYRLRARAWVDIEVAMADGEHRIPSAHVNLVAVRPLARGSLAVFQPADTPGHPTVYFPAQETVANQAFVATGIVLGRFAVRVFTTATTHVVVNLTGVTLQGTQPTPGAAATAGVRPQQQSPLTSLRHALSR
jgi:hypothetical protein